MESDSYSHRELKVRPRRGSGRKASPLPGKKPSSKAKAPLEEGSIEEEAPLPEKGSVVGSSR
jgi:hypothetical protein